MEDQAHPIWFKFQLNNEKTYNMIIRDFLIW